MGYSYPSYDYNQVTPLPDTSATGSSIFNFGMIILIVLFAILIILYAFMIVCYIFQAIGISKMMKRLNLKNSWMAFVPFCNSYAFGKVAEQYIKKDGKKSAKFSVILLVGSIALSIISGVMSTMSFLIGFIGGFFGDAPVGIMMILTVLFSIFVLACSYALMIIQYVALWRIFAIFANSRATLYTIISIFITLSPFFIFASRNNKPVCVEQAINEEITVETTEG